MTKRFGDFIALDDVSMKVPAGSVPCAARRERRRQEHAGQMHHGLLPAGRGRASWSATASRRSTIRAPRTRSASAWSTSISRSVPAMTVAENLVMARADVPVVIDWRGERSALEAFLDAHAVPRAARRQVSALSAGEKQKCEILKQLYLERRFLILDEPTSVLTPQRGRRGARACCARWSQRGELTVLMITHKFREVMAFADEVTILRRGRLAGEGRVGDAHARRHGAA